MRKAIMVLAMSSLAASPAFAQATAFDGEYSHPGGTMGNGASCGNTRFGSRLVVKNGQASMRTVTAGTLEGAVAPDGSVQIQQGSASLTGKIAGPQFSGDLALGRNGNCHFTLDYTRS